MQKILFMKKLLARLQQINWLNYFIEFIIVFLGITIAFYINQRADEQKSLALEKTYLEMIHEDLIVDSVESLQIIAFFEQGISNLKKTSQLISKGKPEDIDSIAYLVSKLTEPVNYHPDMQTYYSLIENGEILLIADLGLRRDMAKYYAYYETLGARHEAVNALKRQKLFTYVSKHYDWTKKKIIIPSAFLNVELKNILYDIHSKEIQRIHAYRKASQIADALRANIRQELVR